MKKPLHHTLTFILLAALSLCLVFVALPRLFPGAIEPLQAATQRLTRPLQQAAGTIERNIAHLYGEARAFEALRLENEALAQQLATLESSARDGLLAQQENERLRSLLDFKARRRELVFCPARLLAPSVDNFSRSITISRGSEDGLSLRDCVVDARGNLIGVIVSLAKKSATVRLVSDAAFELPGEASLLAVRGLLRGDLALMGEDLLCLSLLPSETTLSPGDEVLTLSTEGLYPSGLLVGTVQRIEQDAGGLSARAILSPAASLSQLDQVFVITDFTMEE